MKRGDGFKGRLWALIGFTLLEGVGAVLLVAAVFGLIFWIGIAANTTAAIVIGFPIGPRAGGSADLFVDEAGLRAATHRAGTPRHIRRHRAVVPVGEEGLLAGVRYPTAGRHRGSAHSGRGGDSVQRRRPDPPDGCVVHSDHDAAFVLLSIGSAIAQIITAPFDAGVVVLLYTDRRIRAEAFDLVLQTGAAHGPRNPVRFHRSSVADPPSLTCRR